MTTGKVTTSDDIDKGTKTFDDMKEAVVTIRRNYSDNFEGQSKGSTGWFNLDHKFLKRKFSTLEPDLYNKNDENYIEGQDMEPYKKFLVPFDYTRLNHFMRNYSVNISF